MGSLDWILVKKEAAAQLKTTGYGQTEITENVIMEQVMMGFELVLKGLMGLD